MKQQKEAEIKRTVKCTNCGKKIADFYIEVERDELTGWEYCSEWCMTVVESPEDLKYFTAKDKPSWVK